MRPQFTSLLFKCKTIQQFKQIHTQLLLRGLNHPPSSLRPTISFSALNSFGDINYAILLLFQPSTPPQLFLYNTIIRGLAQSSLPHSLSTSLLVFHKMLRLSLLPNNFTFTFLFQGCGSFCHFDLGRQLHGFVVKNSFALNVFVRNSLIRFYSVCGKLRDAKRVFDETEDIDVVSWNSIINGYLKNGQIAEGLKLFDKMPKRNDISWNSVLSGLVKFGLLDDAYRVFKEMPCRTIVSWVLMISGFAQNGRPETALVLFREMQLLNLEPNSAVLVSVLSACTQLGALDYGNWVFSYIQKRDVMIDSILSAAVVDMYSKCGRIDLAIQVFHSSKEKDVSTYTSAISGLAMNGCSMEAIQLFEEMKCEGILPDSISYMAVLSACTHAGLVEKGFQYFGSMFDEHGIVPELDHYACMVDLLGRAGLLKEAEHFINSMPIKPDNVIWGSLLGACRVHGNAEMGKRIGKMLVESGHNQDGHYILLSNMYADSMKGEDAEDVRNVMRKRKVKRVPGYSLIEVDGAVH